MIKKCFKADFGAKSLNFFRSDLTCDSVHASFIISSVSLPIHLGYLVLLAPK